MHAIELSTAYNPKDFEEKIYQQWLDSGAFAPHGRGGPYYSVVIPPPNVTGILHMGHALNISLQDIAVRFHRMLGESVLWVPCTDHAGIATQNVVEKKLRAQGTSRRDLGRERFVAETWKVKEEHQGTINRQIAKLGASVDWTRERFTLDGGLSRAVREVFVSLYERGLVYKGEYLVNWCTSCGTALADDEVEHEEVPGSLYHIRYPFTDGSGSIQTATTRPETMLGDTAIAVHPDDSRYTGMAGKMLTQPLTGRQIPIITDTYVDRAFGTGCVKITPAHDPNDWEMAQRHKLPVINILTPEGRISIDGPYKGLTVKESRAAILADLQKEGFLVKEEPLTHAVRHCYRCHNVIEPFLSEQWFVKMKPLAQKALDLWRRGDIVFYPQKWENTYEHWLTNVRDWCISRQLWWGHRIPVWYCPACAAVSVSRDDLTACPRCGSPVTQDEDVLDTWFSSWLWPFSTLGWPEAQGGGSPPHSSPAGYGVSSVTPPAGGAPLRTETEGGGATGHEPPVPPRNAPTSTAPGGSASTSSAASGSASTSSAPAGDLAAYYPTTALFTAYDIIFFWVSRMIMAGAEFTGAAPFHDIYIHGLVRDKQGRKMSKSLGNGIDPLQLIDHFGADALKFTLAFMCAQGQDVLIDGESFKLGSKFANKVWNASRYILMNLEGRSLTAHPSLLPVDRWIYSRLAAAAAAMRASFLSYRYNDAAETAYNFFWNDFCDWYVEATKLSTKSDNAAEKDRAITVLLDVLSRCLRLLHPLLPFLTEEIWSRLPAGASLEAAAPADYAADSPASPGLPNRARDRSGNPAADAARRRGVEADSPVFGGAAPKNAPKFDGSRALLILQPYPSGDDALIDRALEADFALLQELIVSVRTVRSECTIPPEKKARVLVRCGTEAVCALFTANAPLIQQFAGLAEPAFTTEAVPAQQKQGAILLAGSAFEAYLYAAGLVDLELLKTKFTKEVEKDAKYIAAQEAKLANPQFIQNAPPPLVESERAKLTAARARTAKLTGWLQGL